MKYIIAEDEQECPHCRKLINIGDICVQSSDSSRVIIHEMCFAEKYGDNPLRRPTNVRPGIQ